MVLTPSNARIITDKRRGRARQIRWTKAILMLERQDVETLIERLKPEDRQAISAMAESDLILLHHGYGTWLRNQFRQNKFPDLVRFCELGLHRKPAV